MLCVSHPQSLLSPLPPREGGQALWGRDPIAPSKQALASPSYSWVQPPPLMLSLSLFSAGRSGRMYDVCRLTPWTLGAVNHPHTNVEGWGGRVP